MQVIVDPQTATNSAVGVRSKPYYLALSLLR
jgi:hypothetical protein